MEELPVWARPVFSGLKYFNPMQSVVFEAAFNTDENLLVAAPTGAGKTDAAILTILNTVAKNIHPNPIEQPDATEFAVHVADLTLAVFFKAWMT